METKLSWRLWAFSLALILTVLVALSFLLDVSAIGATGRFAWNAVMAAVLVSARGLDTIAAFVLRRRIWRLASFFTTVGLGYSGNVILTHAQLERAKGWRGTFRKHVTRLRNGWHALGTPWKCLLVALMIAMQVVLLPVISEYVLLIPIGFMIPLVANGARRFYAWMADSIFAASYRRYLGSTHRAALRSLRARAAPRRARRGAASSDAISRGVAALEIRSAISRPFGRALGQFLRAHPIVERAQARPLHRSAAVCAKTRCMPIAGVGYCTISRLSGLRRKLLHALKRTGQFEMATICGISARRTM
jgi:hypothetical protein